MVNYSRLFKTKKLRLTFKNRWGRFWFRHLRAKRGLVFGSSILILLGGLLIVRLLITANRVIDADKTAAALGNDIDPSQLQREGDGRINILLIGIGGASHVAGNLSDSIMIASIDPIAKELAMVSLPRDLYVPIPGYGSTKINAAHAYGEDYDYPGGGVRLLSDTITEVLDIPIHYYGRVDFDGFRKAIDVVGGVDVHLKQGLSDKSFPDSHLNGYEPFYLSAGFHHLDGETALKYARSRYSTSDFDRAFRQQQLLLALQKKVVRVGTLLDPIKINKLLAIAGKHAKTNISIEDGLKIVDLAKTIPRTQTKQTNLSNAPGNLLTSQVIDGVWVLVPTSGDFMDIRSYLGKLMPDSFLKKEGARIRILNGTGQTGLGQATAELLKTYGYQVAKVGNYRSRSTTVILDHSQQSKLYTLHYLNKRFKVDPRDSDALDGVDITIILGQDYLARQD